MTKAYAILGLVSVLGLSACDEGLEGNGEPGVEPRDLSSFVKVRSNTELDVEIVQGERQQVEVVLDSNLIELVQTRVDDETLYITTVYHLGERIAGPHVRVTVPELVAAKLSGSGSMRVGFDQPEQPLDLYVSGSGNLRFEGRAAAVGAFSSGSGDMRLEGETHDVELALSGSGSIHGRDLSAESGSVDLSGSGDISTQVSESVSVRSSGSGRIDLYGDASIDDYEVTGSGSLVQH
jgi:hypothetical protein